MHYPPPPPPKESAGHPLLDLARQIDCILLTAIYWIIRAVPGLGRFALPARQRLHRTNVRIASLLSRIAAGTWRPSRPRPPGTPPRKGGAPAPYLPRRRFWLGRVGGHRLCGNASQLRTLFADPATNAALATAPVLARAAIARALRTTCRMLDVELPPILQQAGPPPPPIQPKPRRPRAPRPPLDPPLRPYVRAAVRAWKNSADPGAADARPKCYVIAT